MKKIIFSLAAALLFLSACISEKTKTEMPLPETDKYLKISEQQVASALENLKDTALMPRNIEQGQTNWNTTKITSWTSGFFPALLWYIYDFSGQEKWKETAHRWTMRLKPIVRNQYKDHDLGFMIYCSFGNGYRLTENPEYKEIILETADSLSRLFNPNAGTILSWPWAAQNKGWRHNTIIDNMMNLELLFWASKNGGKKQWYDMAVTHAQTTMKNHFRDDFSSYHVVVYDSITGEVKQKLTHQGFADSSMWARGQAWGIYGFTMTYRETQMPEFLETAKKAANIFIERLPEDYVPYWDFDAPNIPDEPKDASAAAIAASALIELSTLVENPDEKAKYRQTAQKMLHSLSANYLAQGTNNAILLHSVGNKPGDSEIDVPIIYADYYFVEALLREKALQEKQQN